MKRSEICNQMRKYEDHVERLRNIAYFIDQRIIEEELAEASLIQFQINLRNCMKELHREKICSLCGELDQKIIAYHKGTVSIDELRNDIRNFERKFRKKVVAECQKLERLLRAHDAIKAMYDAGDEFPEYILPDKFRESFENKIK